VNRDGVADTIRVLLVDGQPAFTEVLAARLAAEPDLEVVGTASQPAHALALVRLGRPHVAVIDVSLNGGLKLGVELRAEAPELRLLVLTDADDTHMALAAVRAGATAWVAKNAGGPELVAALRGVMDGEARMPPRLLGSVLSELVAISNDNCTGPLRTLSVREREVLQCMVDGLNRSQIASELLLSPNTVRTHMQHLLAKLDAHSGLEAVAVALREGMRPNVSHRSTETAPADGVSRVIQRPDPVRP
jgi:DNA-binding NarL/FixJ family response regulator